MAIYKVNVELDMNELAAALASENPAVLLGGDVTVIREEEPITDNETFSIGNQTNNTSNPNSSTIVNTEEIISNQNKTISQSVIPYSIVDNIDIPNSFDVQTDTSHITNTITLNDNDVTIDIVRNQ